MQAYYETKPILTDPQAGLALVENGSLSPSVSAPLREFIRLPSPFPSLSPWPLPCAVALRQTG